MQDLHKKKDRMEPRSSADVIRRQRWELVRTRALQTLQKFDPDQPRDEDGKWTSGGGDGGGDSNNKPNVGLKVNVENGAVSGKRASGETLAHVNAAIAAIPAAHRDELKDVSISIFNSSRDYSHPEARAGDQGFFNTEENSISLAETIPFDPGLGPEFVRDIPLSSVAKVMSHELGHAYGDATGFNSLFAGTSRQDVMDALREMTPAEKEKAAPWLDDPSERFAEIYSLAYSPDKGGTYFGMDYERAAKVWAEPVKFLRSLDEP